MRALIKTVVLLALASNAFAGDSNPTQFTNFNGYTYFVATSIAHGRELWRTYGIPESTELAWEFADGPTDGLPDPPGDSDQSYLFVFNGMLWLAHPSGFYSSVDGETFSQVVDMTILNFHPFVPLSASIHVGDDRLYFPGFDDENETQVWATDGTMERTVRLTTIDPIPNPQTFAIPEIAETNGVVLYTLDMPYLDGSTRVYVTDDSGAEPVEAYPGSRHANLLQVAGDRIFFAGSSVGPHGSTRAILSFNTKTSLLEGWASPRFDFNFAVTPTHVFTGGSNPGGPDELNVCTAPAPACAEIDINPGGGSAPRGLTPWDNNVVFSANRDDTGREIFVSDGTPQGTGLVTEIVSGPDGSNPEDFAPIGGALYFSADNGVLGREPYVATDIAGGHLLLDDINSAGDSNPTEFARVITPFGNPTDFVIFSATDESVGREPYISGGFFGPTELLLDINNPADIDVDGVANETDNCTERQNPVQSDSNADGYGDVCDADLDNSGYVNYADLALFAGAFGTGDPDADFDGDGIVSFGDLEIFRRLFGKPPGPSGLVAP